MEPMELWNNGTSVIIFDSVAYRIFEIAQTKQVHELKLCA